MAIFSIEIADSDTERVLNAVAANYNRDENGAETKAEFANRIVREFLRENVVAYETRLARQQLEARLNVNVNINNPYIQGG